MTTTEMKNALGASTVSVRKGVYTARWEYFWGVTKSGETKRDKVLQLIPEAKVLDYGNHFAPFRWGAPTAKQSHYWVKFTLPAPDKIVFALDAAFEAGKEAQRQEDAPHNYAEGM